MDHATGAPRLAYARLGTQVLQADVGWISRIFYRSPISLGEEAPARGGIPVLLPQFADRGTLPKHGFARATHWVLTQESRSDQAHSLAFELAVAPGQFADWPHACHLALRARARQDSLRISLEVTNTGNDDFAWTGGLHPYFSVDDVLYDACPPLTLFTGAQSLTLTATGFEQWIGWNPGQEGGDALPDLPVGDLRRFVCVEPVCVTRPAKLVPGAVFNGALAISARGKKQLNEGRVDASSF